jgi:hypothetical protein
MKKYYVYAIGKKENLISPYDFCYIGVTNNLAKRWLLHLKSKYTVGQYIRNNNLTFETNMIILFEGLEEICYDIESSYRPLPFMGLNEASGGHGGYTKYTEERNKKISKKHKNRIKTPEHIQKIMSSRKKYNGAENPNSKTWCLQDPKGLKYIIKGNLAEFCQKQGLLESCLRRYKNDVVPNPNYSGFGGYRVKNEKSKILRENTTGWSLCMIQKDREV